MSESTPKEFIYFPWGMGDNVVIEAHFSPNKEEMTLSVIEAKASYEEVRRLAEQANAHQPVFSALSGHRMNE
jgi:hypothetical protein